MRQRAIILFILAFWLGAAGPARAEEELVERYYTMIDDRGKVICRTAHRVTPGDEYLAADNRLYRVERLEGETARVRFVRRARLGLAGVKPAWKAWFSALWAVWAGKRQVQADEKRAIAIFHTHSDESYVPTDGKSSIKAGGGIYKVGSAMAQKLREQEIEVIHDKTPHDPHDAMSYERSRRTAAKLLEKRPVCLIDIHRDAVPRDEYAESINNTEVTKVQLVVGRQNPNRSANEAFAKQIKAAVDKKYPGLIKGIFYGKGKYNQDLAPRLILLEVGSHTNSREAAERGAAIFAAAARDVLYNAGRGAVGGPMRRGSYTALFWLLGIAAAGVVLFLLLNGGALSRLGGNLKQEFAGVGVEDRSDDGSDSSPDDPG